MVSLWLEADPLPEGRGKLPPDLYPDSDDHVGKDAHKFEQRGGLRLRRVDASNLEVRHRAGHRCFNLKVSVGND